MCEDRLRHKTDNLQVILVSNSTNYISDIKHSFPIKTLNFRQNHSACIYLGVWGDIF